MSAFSFITSDNPEPESAEPSSGFGFIQTAAADDLLSSLESSFGSGAAADVDDAEQVAAAELDAQIASADEAVRALVQKVESLDIQKAAAAQARDFRTASTLSKNLQLAKEEKAVKEMELGMLKAARFSPTAIRARSQSSPSAAEPGDEAEQHVPTTPKVDSDSLATWVEQDGANDLAEAPRVGTLLIVNGDTLDEVREWAAADPYHAAGLVESVLVAPLASYSVPEDPLPL